MAEPVTPRAPLTTLPTALRALACAALLPLTPALAGCKTHDAPTPTPAAVASSDEGSEGRDGGKGHHGGKGRKHPGKPDADEPGSDPPEAPPGAATGKSNVLFILADDFSWNLVKYMPNLMKMQAEGVTFNRYFVTDSLCCPSRTSIFTGKFPHTSGVFTNKAASGGYQAFLKNGNEKDTFAVALKDGGYRTAMMGKYLNGYHADKDGVPAGWSEWAVVSDGYKGFNYDLNESGKVVHHGAAATDYLTDVLLGLGDQFVRKGPGPFFLEVATFAPHGPYVPAPRDAEAFPGLKAPRTASFGARAAHGPKWLEGIAPLAEHDLAAIDVGFRKRVQSVQAIDAMIGTLRATLAARGEADHTYVFFSGDNGYHMGEHSLRPGKQTAFDTDIRVPLIVVGPGIAGGRSVDQITENVDLCPTFTDLASVAVPKTSEGHTLVPLLHGKAVTDWRDLALIEHKGKHDDKTDPDAPEPHSGDPTGYEALRMADDSLFVEYADGELEFYDMKADPEQLSNTAATLSAERTKRLRDAVRANRECKDAATCWSAQHLNAARP